MEPQRKTISTSRLLFAALSGELEAAIAVISSLDDKTFTEPHGRNGSLGAHFRHNIELVKALFDGVEAGRIDHSARVRNKAIENDRSRAVASLRALIETGGNFIAIDHATPVQVVSESVPGLELPSSFGRELEFAISHTVHHHALIAERLRNKGFEVDPMFGVAAATRRHWEAEMSRGTSE